MLIFSHGLCDTSQKRWTCICTGQLKYVIFIFLKGYLYLVITILIKRICFFLTKDTFIEGRYIHVLHIAFMSEHLPEVTMVIWPSAVTADNASITCSVEQTTMTCIPVKIRDTITTTVRLLILQLTIYPFSHFPCRNRNTLYTIRKIIYSIIPSNAMSDKLRSTSLNVLVSLLIIQTYWIWLKSK